MEYVPGDVPAGRNLGPPGPEAREVIAAAISPDRATRPATAWQLAEYIEALSPE
jgi:hypothetical protein